MEASFAFYSNVEGIWDEDSKRLNHQERFIWINFKDFGSNEK